MGTAMKSLSDVTENNTGGGYFLYFGILVSVVSIGVITAITSRAIQLVSKFVE
jgi:hypothetical protein